MPADPISLLPNPYTSAESAALGLAISRIGKPATPRSAIWSYDDFLYGIGSTWDRVVGAGGTVAINSDEVGGTVTVSTGGGAGSGSQLITGNSSGYPGIIPSGTGGEWWIGGRIKPTTTFTTNGDGFGISGRNNGSGIVMVLGVRYTTSSTKYVFYANSGTPITSSTNWSGTDPYAEFEAWRVGGTTYMAINGTVAGSQTNLFPSVAAELALWSDNAAAAARAGKCDWIAAYSKVRTS